MRGDLLVDNLLAVFILLASQGTLAQQQEKTPSDFGQTEGIFILKDFKFMDGEVLPELRLHYVTLGSPHRNASHEIDNAILLLHSTGGDATEFLDLEFSEPLFGTGKPFDISKFYLIIPDSIGHGKSSKPSDGLRAHFPHYEYKDMVSAHESAMAGCKANTWW
jgi:homoserine O-acetyltransferase